MAFSTNLFFFLFLPLTLIGYYLIRNKFQNAFLLVASFAFFAWSAWKAIYVLIAVILISYIVSLMIDLNRSKKAKRIYLSLGIIAVVMILCYFKYFNFIIDILNQLTKSDFNHSNVFLPVGISFFVFQSISYMVDVYRGEAQADKNIIKVSLYFAFFPKLTQGPIMRYSSMAGDLEQRYDNIEQVSEGVRRFVIGLAKKLIIADQLGQIVDPIFGLDHQGLSASLVWGGVIAYTLQIYFDFSGYSDMAVGLGKMFGFDLIENFNYPYVSKSITEFWRRWHISLSTWFKDYVYIPLGGNRRGNQYINLLIVFILTGLWHGASWTFVVWGLFHGVLRLIEKITMKEREKVPGLIRWLITMLMVMIGWVFFRAPDLSSALTILSTMFGFRNGNAIQYKLTWFYDNKRLLILLLGLLAMLPWRQWLPAGIREMEEKPIGLVLKYASTMFLFGICLLMIMTSTYSSFIYFKF